MLFIQKLLRKFYVKLAIEVKKYESQASRATLPKFANDPVNLTIEMPRKIVHPERIFIGDNVSLGPNSFLNPMTEYPTRWMRHPDIKQENQHFESTIIIGSNVTATSTLQVSACERVTIEDDVMFASNVYINDSFHGYENSRIPYKYQPLSRISPVTIGRGAWVGQNAVIMPGVVVGEMSVIGANSVVTRNTPPKTIAAGIPAKVIRTFED